MAYAMLAWFAFLQAAPGLVVPHLRDELDIGYSVGGLHVAAFATGSILAGLTAGALERRFGRRALLWGSAAVLALGTVGLTLGRVPAATVGALLVAGWGGAGLLITVQALLADHHGERRAIALTEANVAASVAYVVLVAGLSLTAAIGLGWRAALLVSFALPLALWWRNRATAIETPVPEVAEQGGRLPAAFRVAVAMLFCTVAAEWCITAWGASFAEDAADASADTAVALMFGYFGGVVAGRAIGSRLARSYPEKRLLAGALVVSAAGFALLWPAGSIATVFRRAGRDRPRARQPVPARTGSLCRSGAGSRATGERPRGDGGRISGPDRAADDRRAGRRDVADRGDGRRAGHARSGRVGLATVARHAGDASPASSRAVPRCSGAASNSPKHRRRAMRHSMRSNPPASTVSSLPVRQPRTASRTSGVGRSR